MTGTPSSAFGEFVFGESPFGGATPTPTPSASFVGGTQFRTYGRTFDEFGNATWVEINPDPVTGLPDRIYFATLAQVLRLNLGESPFFANYGLPAHQSVQTQIPPDFYVARTQAQFSQFFASLIIARAPVPIPPPNPPLPTYNATAVTHAGLVLQANVPLAT